MLLLKNSQIWLTQLGFPYPIEFQLTSNTFNEALIAIALNNIAPPSSFIKFQCKYNSSMWVQMSNTS